MSGKLSPHIDPPCPYCGSEDVDWSRKDQKYGCYVCGKMFDGKPPKVSHYGRNAK